MAGVPPAGARVTAVLGIDAAWTAGQPSGVALVRRDGGGWRCLAVAPSYDQFIGLAGGDPVDWAAPPVGGPPALAQVVAAAGALLGGGAVDVVAVDMPLATVPVVGRRAAETAVSRVYGARGCPPHSPDPARPGAIGAAVTAQAAALGYRLATTATAPGTRPALIEVYPHPALLTMVGADYRVRYKLARGTRYWPDLTAAARRRRIVRTWRAIVRVMGRSIGDVDLPVPSPADAERLGGARLKRYEDALDACICAWVAIWYLDGRCAALGDDTGAVWCPVPATGPTPVPGRGRPTGGGTARLR